MPSDQYKHDSYSYMNSMSLNYMITYIPLFKCTNTSNLQQGRHCNYKRLVPVHGQIKVSNTLRSILIWNLIWLLCPVVWNRFGDTIDLISSHLYFLICRCLTIFKFRVIFFDKLSKSFISETCRIPGKLLQCLL